MPIRWKDYHPQWAWIRYYIRTYRAKDHCEGCGIKNYSMYPTTIRRQTTIDLFTGMISPANVGKRVILTIAHLDNNTKNNEFRNLKCLCQKCHLNMDRKVNNEKRKYGKKYLKEVVHIVFSN